MATIPESHKDLFERPVFVMLATVMPNGQPQVTPVWVEYDGTNVVINTAAGRQKDRNLQKTGRATIAAYDPDNPYRWIEVRGTVEERTDEGGVEGINRLSEKYTGNPDYYKNQPGLREKETRIVYRIKPEHVNYAG